MEDIKEKLQIVKAADEMNFLIVFKSSKPFDSFPFEITAETQLSGTLLITRGMFGRIDEAVRKALLWENPQTAALVSDIVLGTLLTSAFTGPFLEDFSLEGQTGNASLSGIEALLTVDLVTQVFKHLSSRQRPGAYFAGSDSHYNSFYSGHAAGAFASATVLTAYALEMDWMDDDLRWVIPTVSYASASLTAYLRVAADRHWLSDVLVGAAVGSGLSYMVLLIRPEFD